MPSKARLTVAKRRAESPATQKFHYISADVTTSPECERVIAETVSWNRGIPPDIVWCASGSSHPTLFVDTPIHVFQQMMDSNYFSCVYMAHAILNVWLRQSNTGASLDEEQTKASQGATQEQRLMARHLIFTASFVSFFSVAGFTPYSPSKAAIRLLSDSLSQEMNLYAGANPAQPHIRIHTVFPGTMPTKSLDDENLVKTDLTKLLEQGDTILSPEEVARRAIAGLERGEELIATSFLTRLVMTSVLGGAIRGGLLKGTVDTILSWIVVIVMVFVRGDMDSKVKTWGQRHGSTGMKKQT